MQANTVELTKPDVQITMTHGEAVILCKLVGALKPDEAHRAVKRALYIPGYIPEPGDINACIIDLYEELEEALNETA